MIKWYQTKFLFSLFFVSLGWREFNAACIHLWVVLVADSLFYLVVQTSMYQQISSFFLLCDSNYQDIAVSRFYWCMSVKLLMVWQYVYYRSFISLTLSKISVSFLSNIVKRHYYCYNYYRQATMNFIDTYESYNESWFTLATHYNRKILMGYCKFVTECALRAYLMNKTLFKSFLTKQFP